MPIPRPPTPRARRMRAAERREQLLDVTLELVTDRGFHALTIDAVAQAAGVSRPIVYKQFEDLPGLLDALMEREEDRALRQLSRAIPSIPGDRDPDELLADGVRLFLEAVQERPLTWRVILLPPEGTPDMLHERVSRVRTAILRQLEKLVAWGIERRGGPRELDSELFAKLVLDVAQDTARLVLTEPERYSVDRIVTFTRVLMSQLARPDRASSAPPPLVDFGERDGA